MAKIPYPVGVIDTFWLQWACSAGGRVFESIQVDESVQHMAARRKIDFFPLSALMLFWAYLFSSRVG